MFLTSSFQNQQVPVYLFIYKRKWERGDVNANIAPIRLASLETASTSTNVLAIDASGDVRNIPFNNLQAGLKSLTFISVNYTATGNETVIWNGGSGAVTLPQPTAEQVGKTIHIVAAANAVSLAGVLPTHLNGGTLSSIPTAKRITIFGIAANVFGNATPTWVVVAKDF